MFMCTFFRAQLRGIAAAMLAVLAPACVLADQAGTAEAQDPYLWLEAVHDPKALAWAAERTKAATAELQAKPLYKQLEQELRGVLTASASPPSYLVLGDKLVRIRRDAAHPHGLMEVAKHKAGQATTQWRLALDVGALREAEGKPYELVINAMKSLCLAPAYERCLLALSPGGADDVELREFDLVKGAFVEGGFRTKPSHIQAAWIDPDRVVIAHTEGGSPAFANGWARAVRMWSRGTPVTNAPVIYTAPPTDSLIITSVLGETAARQAVLTRVIDYQTFAVGVVEASGKVTWAELPNKIKPFGLLASTARHLIVQLAEPATVAGVSYPAESVLAYDTTPGTVASKRVSIVAAPSEGRYFNDLLGFAGVGDQVLMVADRHLGKSIVAATPTPDGWKLRDLMTAPAGESLAFAGEVLGEQGVVMRRAGFTTPASIELLKANGTREVLYTEKPVMDLSGYTTEVRSATSKDGTQLDYYLLQPKSRPADKPMPTLMTGYGGFGFSFQPGYFDGWLGDRSFALWLKRGGALAVPIMRGGGSAVLPGISPPCVATSTRAMRISSPWRKRW